MGRNKILINFYIEFRGFLYFFNLIPKTEIISKHIGRNPSARFDREQHWADIKNIRQTCGTLGRNWADIGQTLGRHWADIRQTLGRQ